MSATAVTGSIPQQATPLAGAQPLPVYILYALFALGFVIYIPVALFRSTIFLLLQDALLLLALLSTLGAPKGDRRAFGGDGLVVLFVLLYCASVLPAVAQDDPLAISSTIQALRSLLFGVIVLYLSSIWLTTQQRAETLIRIFVAGSIFAVFYGMRQLVFGLLPFELERLSTMGAGLSEIDRGRTRIPSAFGDPATFSFVMMMGAHLFLYVRARNLMPLLSRLWYLVLPLLLLGLGITLTRAPMLGLAVAASCVIATSSRLSVNLILKWLAAALGLVALVLVLDQIVSSGVLAQSDAPWARSLDNVLQAVWTLIPAFVTGEVTEQLDRLRSVSADSRLDSWAEGLRFLFRHPFGGGPGAVTENTAGTLQFAPIDVGILRYALELGWAGFIGLVGIWFAVLWAGLRKHLHVADPHTRVLGRYLLALWLGIGVAQAISSYLHTEMLSIMVWSFGGILLNLDRISNRQASVFGVRTAGAAS
ncbi:MAG: hypothetical protein ABI821_16400 [Pseudomonadota bacterium]